MAVALYGGMPYIVRYHSRIAGRNFSHWLRPEFTESRAENATRFDTRDDALQKVAALRETIPGEFMTAVDIVVVPE